MFSKKQKEDMLSYLDNELKKSLEKEAEAIISSAVSEFSELYSKCFFCGAPLTEENIAPLPLKAMKSINRNYVLSLPITATEELFVPRCKACQKAKKRNNCESKKGKGVWYPCVYEARAICP